MNTTLISDDVKQQLIALRRELHANPELSGEEHQTQQRVKAFLAQHGISNGKAVGKTGLLYSYSFGDGPHVLVRVDMDALPIQEVNDFEHRSKVDGVSHKCGHDGHTTIGAGLLIALKSSPLAGGNVDVLFQPAEEIGEGAKAVIADSSFDIQHYDHAISLHNIPGEPLGKVMYKEQEFTPAVQSLIIKLQGKTSHAAQPLKGKNPSYAIGEIINMAKTLEQVDEQHEDYALITPVFIEAGSLDYGISAGYGEIHFTIRSWQQGKMERVTEIFTEMVKTIASHHELELTTDITAYFASNQNDPEVVRALVRGAERLNLSLEQRNKPFPWGEDFGLFTQVIPGAMYGLGSGVDVPALHNPDYDYPDDLTPTAIAVFYEWIKELTSHV